MNDERKAVPSLWLEKLALGELDQVEKARLDARLSPEEQAARVAELEAKSAEFLRLNPPAQRAAEIQRRALGLTGATPEQALSARRRAPAWRMPALGLAAAAALAVLFVHRAELRPDERATDLAPKSAPTEIVKGGPSLQVYRKMATGFDLLANDAPAHAGDLLQLRYHAAAYPFGAIVSVDGRGHATLHFPASPDADTTLRQGGEVSLDHSFELDDAPEFERFIFVTSDDPIDVNAVLEEASRVATLNGALRDGPLSLPAGTQQLSLTVRKTR